MAPMEVETVATVGARKWSPGSWRSCETLQMATYEDSQDSYAATMDKLSKVPPLVQPGEVDALREQLAAAARGEKFIVQGGDCAERFMDCTADYLEAQLKLIVQMGALMESATGMPTVRVARMAGQYGKPRSSPVEKHASFGEIKSYKGENINGYAPTDRAWDPDRLLQGRDIAEIAERFSRAVGATLQLCMIGGETPPKDEI